MDKALSEDSHASVPEIPAFTPSTGVPASRSRFRLPAAMLAILFVWGVGVFFRSYELFPGGRPGTNYHRMAEGIVRDVIRRQIAAKIQTAMPDMPPEMLNQTSAREVDAAIAADRKGFERAAGDVQKGIPKFYAPGVTRHYLLEADGYYFLSQTKNLLRTGRVSEKIENSKFYDPLRLGPKGFWTPVNYLPYVGAAIYKIVSAFRPVSLMGALGLMSLVILLPVAAALYWLWRILGFSRTSYIAAGLALLLCPIFLQRSSYGWYDNDVYNVLFPLLHLAFFFIGIHSARRRAALWGAAAGGLTGIFAMFWVGWPFITGLLFGASAALLLLGLVKRKLRLPGTAFFFLAYTVSSLAFVMIFTSPQDLMEFVSRGMEFAIRFSSPVYDRWPNVFLTVGEANSVTPIRFIHLVANQVSIVAVFIGLLAGGIMAFVPRNREAMVRWIALVLMALPLAVLSFRTERFTLLISPFIAIFTGMAVEGAQRIAAFLAGKRFSSCLAEAAGIFTGFLFIFGLLPMQLLFAHALALKSGPIMNDAWYEAMMYLKEHTPPDSYVQSWWPPGYFITAVAERHVSSDGGTQHLPETYWIARFYMSADENEALGILRMLHQSGNDAVDYLTNSGMSLDKAVDLINGLLPMRSEAEIRQALSGKLTDPQISDFLKLFLFQKPPHPAYAFIYSEMIEKNLAIALHARWNFRKAREMALSQPQKSAGKDGYIKNMIDLSEGILKYQAEAKLKKRTDTLFFFDNGLVVNIKDKDAVIVSDKEQVQGRPYSLLYVENGQLREVFNNALLLDVSALIYEKDGHPYAVLADRRLLRSMLFRLFYLDGAGLSYFEPAFKVARPEAETEIKIFRVLWDKYLSEPKKE